MIVRERRRKSRNWRWKKTLNLDDSSSFCKMISKHKFKSHLLANLLWLFISSILCLLITTTPQAVTATASSPMSSEFDGKFYLQIYYDTK